MYDCPIIIVSYVNMQHSLSLSLYDHNKLNIVQRHCEELDL